MLAGVQLLEYAPADLGIKAKQRERRRVLGHEYAPADLGIKAKHVTPY
jgi:hypothetical protein